jgi:xanthine dehydrogenase FAD-binding subunit
MVSASRPQSLAEALRIRSEARVIPFAGGTDLMVKHRRPSGLAPGFAQPILFVGHLPELRHITAEGNALVIGAGVTLSDLLAHGQVPGALKQSVAEIASPAIRNMATLGGNICNASPAGDTLPALYCLDATLVLARVGSERRVGIERFILGPGKTDLRDDELLKAVILPLEHFDLASYRKVGTRKANALSKISFLGLARTDGGQISDLRVAFGAVSPTVVRSRGLESECIGLDGDGLVARLPRLLEGYARLIVPIDDQRSTAEYRKAVSLRLLARFLAEVAAEAEDFG